jgi:hypothetical protein
MLEASSPDAVMQAVMQATMPALESGDKDIMAIAKQLGPDAQKGVKAIDWVRYGQMLRAALIEQDPDTWASYPETPPRKASNWVRQMLRAALPRR